MGEVRLMPATAAAMPRLVAPCHDCLAWQQGAVPTEGTDSLTGKEDWARTVLAEWGMVGIVAECDEQVVGHLLFAPARFLPAVAHIPAGPVSEDAVVLTGIRVASGQRGTGLGRRLVLTSMTMLMRQGVAALEAFSVGPVGLVLGGVVAGCGAPPGFLKATGFVTVRSRHGQVLHRLDQRRLARAETEAQLTRGSLFGLRLPAGWPEPGACRRRQPPARPSISNVR